MDFEQENNLLKEIIELQRKVIELQSKTSPSGSWTINTNPSLYPSTPTYPIRWYEITCNTGSSTQ